MTKILLTGCCGYIGSVLTDFLLRNGHYVIGIDNLMYKSTHALLPYLGNHNFEFHKLDVQDYLPVNKLAELCDIIIPLAALVGAPACDKNQRSNEYANSVNSSMIARLVESLSSSQRVLFPNTNSGYGATNGSRYCVETDQLSPISTYAWTKCQGEKAVLEHPNSVSLRLATVFGASPRMRLDLMVNDFVNQLVQIRDTWEANLSYTPFEIFEPHFMRNFVGIRDVARAFVFMVGTTYTGVFNLGNPDANLTKRELAVHICNRLRLPTDIVVVGEGQDPDQRNYLVSNDKILKAGFHFIHTLNDGIDEVAKVCELFSDEQRELMRNA